MLGLGKQSSLSAGFFSVNLFIYTCKLICTFDAKLILVYKKEGICLLLNYFENAGIYHFHLTSILSPVNILSRHQVIIASFFYFIFFLKDSAWFRCVRTSRVML